MKLDLHSSGFQFMVQTVATKLELSVIVILRLTVHASEASLRRVCMLARLAYGVCLCRLVSSCENKIFRKKGQ